jgi:reactive intermediate/imine deaminase
MHSEQARSGHAVPESPNITSRRETMRLFVLTTVLLTGVLLAGPLGAGSPDRVEFLNSGKLFPEGLPFSEAVRVGNLLFLSGQIGIKPGTLELVEGGIEQETRQTMENIRTIHEIHGFSLSQVVKCTVMLADISEWATFNAVYKTFFTVSFPARSALGANGLALGARVEVECIAARAERP